MANYPAQTEFLQKIKEILPAHQSLADELSDLLEISSDSAYRRIRGDSALSLDEAIKICHHFKVSIDLLAPALNGANTNFRYESLHAEQDHLKMYMQNILTDLEQLARIPDSRVIYAAEDLPLFMHFYFPEHAAFKLFYWAKSVLNLPQFGNKKFTKDVIAPEIFQIGQKIVKQYAQISSSEIWAEGVADSTIKQIRYYWECGLFERKEEAVLVCEQFIAMLETMRQYASRGSKLEDGTQNFLLYLSEIEIGNNCILVESAGKRKVYLRHQTFNFISTANEVFCNDTNSWLENYIRKSTPVSGVSEKERNKFFNKKKEEVERLMMQLQ